MNQDTPDPTAAAQEEDLLHRSGPLKMELVAFGQSDRFAREFRAAYADRFPTKPRNESDYINFLDRFVLEHRTRDGRTIVEQFAASRPDLPPAERAMLAGWANVVEGIFEVEHHNGHATVMVNLIDELTYPVCSNKGPRVLEQFAPQTTLLARIVPLGSDWLLSGSLTCVPPEGLRDVRRIAAQLANTSPAAVFRNPDKIALGWELHHRLRKHFIEYFGTDLAVVAGPDLADQMAGFWNHHAARIRAAHSPASAETTTPSTSPDDQQQPPPIPQMPIPPDLYHADTVGIMFDETDGLWFLPEYRLVHDVFADPTLTTGRRREAISGYLKSPNIPPVVLHRLAADNPDHASQVFARLLNKPHFTWQHDAEALLRRYKADLLDRTPLPGVTPLSDQQRAFLQP